MHCLVSAAKWLHHCAERVGTFNVGSIEACPSVISMKELKIESKAIYAPLLQNAGGGYRLESPVIKDAG